MKTDLTYVYGKNAIRASLDCGKLTTLFVATHLSGDPLTEMARKKDVSVKLCDAATLTGLAHSSNHQGFVGALENFQTYSLEDIIIGAKKKPYPLVLLLDGIEDPHNLGAILRSADAFGVDGVVIKNHGEVPLNGTVAKVSTGAINYVKVAVVANLSQAIAKLKEAGYWVVASDGSATQSYTQVDYRSPIALVIGSEGFGIAPLVLKNSDFIIKIPMCGHVNSLNASVATGILLSAISSARQ